jgi:hypothetical protein
MKRLVALIAVVLLFGCTDNITEPVDAPSFDVVVARDAPVERRIFIHRQPGFSHNHGIILRARPDGRGKPSKEANCFSELARGAVWKNTEPYRTTFPLPVATWEFESDVFGAEEAGAVPAFDGGMDGLNTAQFGFYDEPNVIAVTSVWGIFRGPPSGRELLEWDILMNTQFPFGDADVDPTIMDVANIATHELGHALGLGHPENSCTEETMYAYSATGETKKRTLEAGDIAGVRSLY